MKQAYSIHGISLPILREEVSNVIWNSLTTEKYEAKEARQVQKFLRDGDRILELGSGIGVITTIMAKEADVEIWSFDANPHVVSLARRVAAANTVENATFNHGLMTSGKPCRYPFYIRRDLWMSSLLESQGPYESIISVESQNIDEFISAQNINVLVMDIEGAERDLLCSANLHQLDRVFLELHDHLYGLQGIRDIFSGMADRGFIYDPRSSAGPCVLFSRDDGSERNYEEYEI